MFENDGFRCVREEGDHLVFTKPGVLRPVVIPRYHAVPVFIIKNNLRTAQTEQRIPMGRTTIGTLLPSIQNAPSQSHEL